MRIKSWLKNTLVFVPILFAQSLFDTHKFIKTALAFLSFCFISSAVYVFNDICDLRKDANHPVKRFRPIAEGRISLRNSYLFMSLLVLFSCYFAIISSWKIAFIALIFFAINIAYSLFLKHKAIYDVFCIATGFVLRTYAGSISSNELVSDWLFLTVVSMSLFMAFGKRHGEIIKIGTNEKRMVLLQYNSNFLTYAMCICAGLTIIFYSLWAMNRMRGMIFTVPIVIFIIFKYLLIINENESFGDPTTIIYSSKNLLASLGLYVISILVLLYLN
jgi:4-hydroxybenzoate polyprenyltransferase